MTGKEVRALRRALAENTATFGARFLKSGRTIEAWEQDRSVPDAFVLEGLCKLAARTKKQKAKKA